MEKPKSIEVGQRYEGVFSKQVFTVVARMGRDWRVEYEDGEKMLMRNPSAEGTYLGPITSWHMGIDPGRAAAAYPVPVPVDPYADTAFTFDRGEKIRYPQGTPLTALQAIQSRPKPEPYICPVDDWDLLADA
jgi:hypothetical protein